MLVVIVVLVVTVVQKMHNFEEVKRDINLIDHVRQDIGPPEKDSGNQCQWQCPFHSDSKTPSLTVWADHFHCYGCGAHGTIYDWQMRRTGCDFKTAHRELTGEDVMASRPTTRTATKPAITVKQPPPDEWQDRAVLAIRDCYVELWESDKSELARQWLKARGLNEGSLKDRWIGFNSKAREIHGHWLERGIVIPHFHEDKNTVWGIKIRKSDKDQEPKYIHVKGSVPYLYGVETLASHEKAFVCEGEFDAILLDQFIGHEAGVMTFGSATNHDIDTWLEYLGHIKRFYIATDNDAAGEKAWEYWKSRTKRARRCIPPMDAKDITDAWKLKCDLQEWARGEMLK